MLCVPSPVTRCMRATSDARHSDSRLQCWTAARYDTATVCVSRGRPAACTSAPPSWPPVSYVIVVVCRSRRRRRRRDRHQCGVRTMTIFSKRPCSFVVDPTEREHRLRPPSPSVPRRSRTSSLSVPTPTPAGTCGANPQFPFQECTGAAITAAGSGQRQRQRQRHRAHDPWRSCMRTSFPATLSSAAGC